MDKSISRVISEFAVNLKYEDLPKEVIHEVKRYLFDSIGCAFGAFNTADVKIIRDIYVQMRGRPEATLFVSGEKIPAVNAAFVNSLMIRSLDFNDIYWKNDPSHPSDLIAAALSTAELINADMKDVITAIVLGYEFEQRFCEFAVPGIRERKWHHASLTQFVSPIVAGKILRLNVEQMVNAIGINGSHNFTVGAPTAGKLTMMKNIVDPMTIQSGVFAALIAQKGCTGNEFIFEGKEGFMDCFGGWDQKKQIVNPVLMKGRDGDSIWSWNKDGLVQNLGQNYKILSCSMKAFPTEALTHTYITAALKLVNDYNINWDQIDTVMVTTINRAYDILFDPHKYHPDSRETADHSLPYCIAAAIVDRNITTNSFSMDKLKDPRIWEIINNIKGEPSLEFEKLFPEKQPSKVVIKTKDGNIFSEYIEYPKGDPREPMTINDLERKFNSLTSPLLSSKRQREISLTIFNCEELSAKKFMSCLVVKPDLVSKNLSSIKKVKSAGKQKVIRRKEKK